MYTLVRLLLHEYDFGLHCLHMPFCFCQKFRTSTISNFGMVTNLQLLQTKNNLTNKLGSNKFIGFCRGVIYHFPL